MMQLLVCGDPRSGPWQVFPFRGEPHVHAFLNVAMDGERPISLGEPLGDNPETLEGDGLRARGIAPQAARTYRIATTGHVARYDGERIGRPRARRNLGLLRDALAAHARALGFRRAA